MAPSKCLKHQENCEDCVRASCTYIQRRDDSWECVEEISGGVMDLIDPGTPELCPATAAPITPTQLQSPAPESWDKHIAYGLYIIAALMLGAMVWFAFNKKQKRRKRRNLRPVAYRRNLEEEREETVERRTVEFDEYVDDDEEFYADAFDYPLPFPHVDNVAPSRQGTPAPYSRQGTPVPHSRQATPFPPSRYGTPAPPTREATPLREATPFREGASTREPSPFVQEPPVTPIPMRAPPTPQEILQQMERQIVSSPQPEELRERRPARIRRQFHDLVITTTKTKTYRKN